VGKTETPRHCRGVSTFQKKLIALRIDYDASRRYRSGVKVREVLRLIEQDGWYLVRTRGSHGQYKHPVKPGLVTLPGKPGDDLAPGTLNSVLKQAGLKP
jgi:predicted RNA binding protein YcfA (HicA-like mRNA interferase family)